MRDEFDESLNTVVNYLADTGNAQAVFLCGSRAVGDFKPNSDWDLKILVDKIREIPLTLENIDLDVTQHLASTSFSFEEFGLKLRYCRILVDNEFSDAQRIYGEAQEFYEEGPGEWTKNYALSRIDKVRRYENKFEDCIACNDWFGLHQRLNWHFLENSYSWWFGLRGEWEPRPQNIIKVIRERDTEFAGILEEIATPMTSDLERVELFRKLHRIFFESREFELKAGLRL